MLFHISFLQIFLQALIYTAVTASPTSIWHVSIWEAPAPPPGKGPPLSASSLRDLSYLPAQIAAIVGAYVFSVLVIGSAILFVGRRLRRAAQASPGTLSMEMMKPVKQNIPKAFDPSPISPSMDNNSYGPTPNSAVDMKNNWPSPNKNRGSSGWGSIGKGHKKQASVQSSVLTFDESVIEDDKERSQREMERLYSAVLEHDEKKSTSRLNVAEERQVQSPPELQHLRSTQDPALRPPRQDPGPSIRTLTSSPRKSSKPASISVHSQNSSRSSFGSLSKKRGVRGLPISPPMGSPELVPDYYNNMYEESEPLSPRVYDEPGPPPPTPPLRKLSKSREGQLGSNRLSPKSARFAEPSLRAPRSSIPAIPAVHTIHESPNAAQPRTSNNKESVPQRDITKTKRTPAPLSLRTEALSGSSSQPHPLQSAPLPLRNHHPTNYNSDRPPSMIKATVLERKTPKHGFRTPHTGVPMTPYSPYMPYTPLTPMTPSRLVTREERKRREKEEGRRVATMEDAVEEEPDMWGDAYP